MPAGKSARIYLLVLCFGGSHGQKAGKKKMVRAKSGQKKKMVQAKSGQKKDGAGKKLAKKEFIITELDRININLSLK